MAGYYDTSKGIWISDAATELDRVNEAMNYYQQNNMSGQLAGAQNYLSTLQGAGGNNQTQTLYNNYMNSNYNLPTVNGGQNVNSPNYSMNHAVPQTPQTPQVSALSTTNAQYTPYYYNAGDKQSIASWGQANGINVYYDPVNNLTYVNNVPFAPNKVPGMTYDPVSMHNYVTNPNELLSAIGIQPQQPQVPQVPQANYGQDMMNMLNEWWNNMQGQLIAPTQNVGNFDDAYNQMLASTNAAREVARADLEQNKNQNIKAMAAHLAGQNLYGSSLYEDRAADIYNTNDRAVAALEAAFSKDAAALANQLYGTELGAYTSGINSYNQGMVTLGSAFLNGMIDINKFISDDAYRQAVLATDIGRNALAELGTIA